MAYQTRREPLFDSSMSAALEKRGKELIGLALIGLALAVGAMVYSYSPADPSWMTVTDGPVRNWLGAPGASLAAPLFMILGWGVWSLAIVPGAWGLRLVAHRGAARAPGRLIFAPVWLALLSLHAATLAPGAVWAAQHSFGLGGLFGDMALGTLLGVLPVDPGLGLRLVLARARRARARGGALRARLRPRGVAAHPALREFGHGALLLRAARGARPRRGGAGAGGAGDPGAPGRAAHRARGHSAIRAGARRRAPRAGGDRPRARPRPRPAKPAGSSA